MQIILVTTTQLLFYLNRNIFELGLAIKSLLEL